MIKITKATYVLDHIIELRFSDGSTGKHDFAPLLERRTSLTEPLLDPGQFQRFFLDLGALCWPNGLELSPSSLHEKMSQAGELSRSEVA